MLLGSSVDRPTNWFDGEFPQISGATGHCGAARFGLALKTHEISEAGMADNQSLQRQRTNACLQKKGWRFIEDE